MRLYAYGLCDDAAWASGALEGCGAGVGGAPARVIRCGSLAAVVGEFGGERVRVTREHVAAHNRVLGHVLARGLTPLPFRFGTLADAARLEQFVAANETSLLALLARVRGCVEMSVKVMWDAPRPTDAPSRGAPAVAVAAVRAPSGGGAEYLVSKRRGRAGGEELRARAEEVAAWLAGRVGGAVKDSSVRVSPQDALVVRAAHLVECERLEDYRERVRAARAERARELKFLTSGAWPPYSFCELSP